MKHISLKLVVVIGVIILSAVFLIAGQPAQSDVKPDLKTKSGEVNAKETMDTVPEEKSKVLFRSNISGPDRIYINEFSHYSSPGKCPYSKADWQITSGTLLVKDGMAYSGLPTKESQSICESATRTNSSVFRLNTTKNDFKNVRVSLNFKIVAHGGQGVTNKDYDGLHIWVGHKGKQSLYSATIFRWDNNIVIKKKLPLTGKECPDKISDGCYYNLSQPVSVNLTDRVNEWQHADIDYTTLADGSVLITTRLNGEVFSVGTDKSIGGPVNDSGAVGVRGDNTEFYFQNFTVTSLN